MALRLPRPALALYALPGLGLGFMESLIQFYLLKFAVQVLGLAPAALGVVLGLARVWDGVTDPLAGYASDRTRSALGRRRPWLLASALPLGAAFVAVWCVPSSLPPAGVLLWLGGALLLFESAQSAFQVPHLALAAELGAERRNHVFGARLAATLAGFLLGALALGSFERAPEPRGRVALAALAAGIACAGLCLLCGWRVREPRAHDACPAPPPGRAFGDVFRNRQARRLLVVVFLEAIGFATMTTSLAFASEHLYERRAPASALLAGALIATFASVPLWLLLARRFERRRLWLASLAGRALAFAALGWLPPSGGALLALNVAIGLCFGAGRIFGPAVQADVVEDEERRSGERKEGSFFACWNLVEKGGQGAAVVLAGAVLELSRFQPGAAQDPGALQGLRLLASGLPCAFYAAAALLLARFPRSSLTVVSASQAAAFSAAKVTKAPV